MLELLFEPKTIAVIGASEHKEKVGGALMRNLQKFKGEVIPINPSHDLVFEKKCYKSILDYNGKIDLAVIAIPAQLVLKVISDCEKKKIPNVIIITAGFSEIGNTELESKIVAEAKKNKIRLLGPNCFGICNPHLELDTTFAMHHPKKGDVAFISQSGALWSYIADLSYSNHLGFSKFASLGNMSDLEFIDILPLLDKDAQTKSIVLYIEKLKDGKKFILAAKKCSKPIYAVKAGSSKSGAEAAISHTGSLATDFEIYKGAFKQAGVILCETLEEAFEKASGEKMIAQTNQKTEGALIRKIAGKEKEIAIITNAGGAGALIADYCSNAGIKIISIKDVLGTALADDYKKEIMKTRHPIIALLTPQKMTEIEKTALVIIEAKKKGKNIVAAFLGNKSIINATEMLRKADVACFNTFTEAKLHL